MQQLEKKHIRVRVTVLLRRKDGKICFVRHLKDGQRYWLLPGGGQESGEAALDTASRELFEELQLTATDFRLLFVRESFNKSTNRHIQFLVFEASCDDFSMIATGTDERVEGYDFFSVEEIEKITIYPAMKKDIIDYAKGKTPELFKTLEWVA